MLSKILIASGNPHKKEKLSWIVDGYFEQIQFLDDIQLTLQVEEDAPTFKENAAKKAVEFSKQYEDYVIASDGGLSIPALGNSWNGLYTKRFSGEKSTDIERINGLLKLMRPLEGNDRRMVWNEAVAIAKNGVLLFAQQVEGIEGVAAETLDPSKYKEGIWACSIWYFPQWGKNFFDLGPQEVEAVEISWHRLRAATRAYLASIKDDAR